MEKVYRQGIVIILINKQNEFLLAQLPGYASSEWNFVGKGNIENSTLEGLEAATRATLQKKLNISSADFEIVSFAKDPIQYDFPEVRLKDDGKMYHGQVKIPVIVRFVGDITKISPLPERIKEIKWVSYGDLKDYLVFPGQYDQFRPIIGSLKYFIL